MTREVKHYHYTVTIFFHYTSFLTASVTMTIGRHAHLYIDHQELQINVAYNDSICHHWQYRIHRVCQNHTALTGDKLPQQHGNHRTLVLIRADRLAPQPRRICEFQSLKFSKRHTTLPAVGLLISWTANANDSNMVWNPLLITTLCILLKTSCDNRFSSTRCHTVNYDPPHPPTHCTMMVEALLLLH